VLFYPFALIGGDPAGQIRPLEGGCIRALETHF
jgi:hypothetical protein